MMLYANHNSIVGFCCQHNFFLLGDGTVMEDSEVLLEAVQFYSLSMHNPPVLKVPQPT